MVPEGTRDGLKQALLDAGIGVDIYYPVPLHLQECFVDLGYQEGDIPISEEVAKRIIALPIYPETSHEQREYVVAKIEEFLG